MHKICDNCEYANSDNTWCFKFRMGIKCGNTCEEWKPIKRKYNNPFIRYNGNSLEMAMPNGWAVVFNSPHVMVFRNIGTNQHITLTITSEGICTLQLLHGNIIKNPSGLDREVRTVVPTSGPGIDSGVNLALMELCKD